eukprot:jgi/Psemu1/286788/fgenesh1_pg.154_\
MLQGSGGLEPEIGYETEIKIDTETGDGDSLERSRALRPPTVESTLGGEAEGADWWNDHSDLLRRAWDEWWELLQALEPATTQTSSTITAGRGLPALDVHQMVRPDLAWDAHRARTHPSLVNERNVLSHWELMAVGKNKSSKHRHNNSNGGEENEDEHKMGVGSESVARCPGFLTPSGIRLLRTHLDAISNSGIPVRRPNAMNRRGLLLEPSVPGGVEGGPQLQEFLEVLVGDYLRPIGRSLFPELAGDPADDSQFYAFTIRYEATEGTETDEPTTTTTTTVPHDTDLGEHSDASLYTLNLNLNLPDEDYEGSSLYFAPEKDPPRKTDHRTGTRIGTRTLVDLAPGTAVVHRGSTKHGALPIVRGQRHNLVVWLHGPDGYVRTHPYPDREWLSTVRILSL